MRPMKLGIPLREETARTRVNMRRGDATSFVAHLLRQLLLPPRHAAARSRAYGIPYNNPLSRRSFSFRRFDPPFISRPLRSRARVLATSRLSNLFSRFFYLPARFPILLVPCM
jgi:hypothetical protein